jgi:hypothetical protein
MKCASTAKPLVVPRPFSDGVRRLLPAPVFYAIYLSLFIRKRVGI